MVFIKGQSAWNKGKKGVQVAWNKGKVFKHKGSFKKGHKMNVGSKRSEATKKKMRNNHADFSGEKNPFWKGGTSYEPYSIDWTKTLKRSIRERDKYTCQICGELQEDITFCVHHIDMNKKNCNPNNLITLCKKCHYGIHQKRI